MPQPTVDSEHGDQRSCPVCDATPVVLVALRHPVLRVDAIGRTRPDLVVVDDSDFPSCCQAALDRMPPERVMVVGPEPDTAYRSLALANGAGGWVCREQVGDDLSGAMRAALGCRHDPCPPGESPARRSSLREGVSR
mgnify:CR=1 FL=1